VSKTGQSIIFTVSKNLSNLIKHLSLGLAGVFLLINVVDVLISIFFRYFLRSSLIWTEEVARYTLIYAVMFGATAALSYGEHVHISVFARRLPAPLGRLVRWIRNALITGILLLMTYLSVQYAKGGWRSRALALGIPRAIPLMALPIGMALLVIQYVLVEITRAYSQRNEEESS
jgi:TRAP-type C4-dicarboxylate transport system permease small subunit